MAATAAVCDSYTQELYSGTHTNTDTYKIALYTAATANLSAATTVYSVTGEVVGAGYTAGGMNLTGFTTSTDTGVAILDFTTDPSWTSATITADSALIYNSSKTNKAVAVLSFTSASSTNGTWTLTFPAATAAAGLIRIS
jgi:hypothetical protein